MMFVRPSVCLSVGLSKTDVHCDHTVHFIVDLSLDSLDRLDSPMFWASWDQSMSTTPNRLFQVSPGRKRGGVWACKL